MSKSYAEKLKDPRWQRKRLEIMQRDQFKCSLCYDGKSTLNVHHNYYVSKKEPWEYPNESLWTACEECHKSMDETRAVLQELAGGLHPEVQNMLAVFLVPFRGLSHGDQLCLLQSIRLSIDRSAQMQRMKTEAEQMEYLEALLSKLRNHNIKATQ